ncbi:MAG: trypsin-like serine protease [Leptolyngbya sp. SIOISBB]|nr:trypsin-like serine protease [Leptolyngbya sp. SIOISBB]
MLMFLEGSRQLSIMRQGHRYNASVVSMGDSRCLDLALIQIEGVQNLPTVSFGDTDSIYKTQAIYAIGFPFGNGISPVEATITRGIVSNIHSEIGRVQLDGPINPGNSGGPVVNDNGDLIGIATSGRGNDVNFAVSVDKVIAFVEAYQNGIFVPAEIMVGSQPDDGSLSENISFDGRGIQGLFQNQDSRFCGDGSLADLYTFEAKAGESIMLDMISQDLGSFLFLFAPNGNLIARSGNQDRNQAAVILEKLPQTGTYTVVANAAAQGQTGHYQLQGTQPILVENGAIYSSDRPCFEDGQRCLSYQFQGSAQQAITLLLHHADFDPYIMLIDPAGEVVSQAPTDRQTTANFVLNQDGWYTVVIGTSQPEESGNFIVSVHDTEILNPQSEVSQR